MSSCGNVPNSTWVEEMSTMSPTHPSFQQPRQVLPHPGDVLQLVKADLKPRDTEQNTAEFNSHAAANADKSMNCQNRSLASVHARHDRQPATMLQQSRKAALPSTPRFQNLQHCHSRQDPGVLASFSTVFRRAEQTQGKDWLLLHSLRPAPVSKNLLPVPAWRASSAARGAARRSASRCRRGPSASHGGTARRKHQKELPCKLRLWVADVGRPLGGTFEAATRGKAERGSKRRMGRPSQCHTPTDASCQL